MKVVADFSAEIIVNKALQIFVQVCVKLAFKHERNPVTIQNEEIEFYNFYNCTFVY